MADNMDIKVGVDVEVTGEQAVEKLDRAIVKMADDLNKGLKVDPRLINSITRAQDSITKSRKASSDASLKELDSAYKLAKNDRERAAVEVRRSRERRLNLELAETMRSRAARDERRDETASQSLFRRGAAEKKRNSDYLWKLRQSTSAQEEKSFIQSLRNFASVNRAIARGAAEEQKTIRERERGYDRIQRTRERFARQQDREAKVEKTIGDSRERHMINQQNAMRGLNMFMDRQIGKMAYRGSIEEQYAGKALKNLRDQSAQALRNYRNDTRAAKSRGEYDAAAEQRIQNRFNNEVKFARRAFNNTMTLGRDEQQADNRRYREKVRLEREYAREREKNFNTTMRQASIARNEGANVFRAARAPGVAAIAAGAATAGAVRHGISSRMDVDTAETKLRMFGGTGTSPMSQADVVGARKGWLDASAVKNGFSPAAAINAYTEVLKAGFSKAMSKDVTEMVMSGAAGADMPIDETTKLISRLHYLKPGMGSGDLKKSLSDMAVVAASTGADPNELVSSLRRGAGALGESKISVGDLAAFTGVGVSTGIQEGQAGTFIEHQINNAINAKNMRGQRKKDLSKGYQMLGMGSLGNVSREASENTGDFLEKMYIGLNNLSKLDTAKAAKAAHLIGQDEWGRRMLMMAAAADPKNNKIAEARGAIRNPENTNYLDRSNSEKMSSWKGLWNSASTSFSLFWESFGKGFDGILRDITGYFIDVGKNFNFSAITDITKSALEGIKVGLGFNTWREGMESIFGKPGSMGGSDSIANLRDIRKFFKGLTEGLLDIASYGKKLIQAFGGDTSSIAAMGKLTGHIIGLSIALIALSPVIGILGGITSMVLGIVAAGRAISGVAKMAGVGALGFAGKAGGGMLAGAGLILSRMFFLVTAAEIGSHRGEIATMALNAVTYLMTSIWDGLKAAFSVENMKKVISGTASAVAGELIPAPIQRMFEPTDQQKSLGKSVLDGVGKPNTAPATPEATPQQRVLENTNRSLERLNNTIDESARFQRQSYQEMGGPGGFAGLIQKASLLSGSTGAGLSAAGITRVSGSSGGSAGSLTVGSGPLATSVPGSALGGGSGLSRRGIIGGAGSAAGPGPGNGGGSGMVGYGANPGAYKPFLDYIAGTEGTAKGKNNGYDVTLANGKLLPGGKEQDLTKMTLDQIDAMQGGMLNHPGNKWNSSASGRYQIVRKTLRGLRSELGLKGTDLFDEGMQDRLGATLAKRRGANGSLGQEWASLRGGKLSDAVGLLGQVPGGSSTTPGNRPADSIVGAMKETAAGARSSSAVDNASKLIGAGSSQAASALGSKMNPGQWCADFVNGALQSSGLKGVNSSIANSFLGWGKEVTDGVKKGDVLVESRGKGVGSTGGHVGLATGETRMKNGRLQYEEISGNHGNRVASSWTDAAKLTARRTAEEDVGKKVAESVGTSIGDGFTSSGWKKAIEKKLEVTKDTMSGGEWKGENGGELSPEKRRELDMKELENRRRLNRSFGGQGNAIRSLEEKLGIGSNGSTQSLGGSAPSSSLGSSAPMRQPNTQPQMQPSQGGNGGGGGGGGGNGGSVIHINGHNGDPEALANSVQRRLNEAMNRRTHDIDHVYA